MTVERIIDEFRKNGVEREAGTVIDVLANLEDLMSKGGDPYRTDFRELGVKALLEKSSDKQEETVSVLVVEAYKLGAGIWS